MTIKELISYDSGAENVCEAYSIVNEDAIICGVIRLEEWNIGALKPDILYVTSFEHLPKALPGNETYNFLLLMPDGDMDVTVRNMIITRCNLLVSEASPEKTLFSVQNIIFDGQRLETQIRLVTEALFSSGIRKMIAIGAELMKCPLMLVDHSGDVTAKDEGKTRTAEGSGFAQFWEQDNVGAFLKAVADNAYPSQNVQQYVRFPDMQVFKVEKIDRIVMAVPIRINRIEIGKLMAFFGDREPTVPDGELLYRVALILADDLQRHNVFKVGHKKRYLNFMWMLLEDKYPNPQAINKAMEELDIVFKGKCCVAVIHALNEADPNISQGDMIHVLSIQVDAKLPDVLWLVYNDELVILFNLEKDEEIPEYDLSVLRKMSETNEVSVGISYSFNQLVGVSQLYWQAGQAAEFGYEFLRQHFTLFREISHFSMMRLIQQKVDPMVFVDPDLMSLFSKGKENYQEYFNTLYYYLKYGGNTSAVAAKTHMHRNTVLYRIDKLQQQLNFDLTDGVSTMKLMLSFEIMKFLKFFKADD